MARLRFIVDVREFQGGRLGQWYMPWNWVREIARFHVLLGSPRPGRFLLLVEAGGVLLVNVPGRITGRCMRSRLSFIFPAPRPGVVLLAGKPGEHGSNPN